MAGGLVVVVTVVTTTPLTVRESAGAATVAARVHSGSSYTATIGDRVIAAFTAGRYYVFGKA